MPTKAFRTVAILVLALAMAACTPWQAKQWGRWYQSDPEGAQSFLDAGCPGVDNGCEVINSAASGDPAPAVRLDPPAPPSSGGGFSSANNGVECTGALGLLSAYSPGWDVHRMARIMFRESRCQPGAYNRSGASGLLQIMKSHCGWLAPQVGPCNLFNPTYNVRAGAALFRAQGYGAWSTS